MVLGIGLGVYIKRLRLAGLDCLNSARMRWWKLGEAGRGNLNTVILLCMWTEMGPDDDLILGIGREEIDSDVKLDGEMKLMRLNTSVL